MFIRRKQVEELRADCYDIFRPVRLTYDAASEIQKQVNTRIRHIHNAPFPSHRLTA